ncbi:DsbA family protein [Stakelama sediminis]|uniref:Protein-disulfide isomerase n=1 Tax=Stakelama sediminis TaxID=463200 RepID=A0A840YWQ1_9SPHN|nr:thioredoxin domain-containing protein [Stakelama sediminis]MBB5718151.1 protein-disulfide isomerase [Stakelama sediminis]
MRFLLLLFPALLLAACSGGNGSAIGNGSSATPVASVKPPAGKQWSDVVSATPEGGHVMGNPNAPIKLVEYGSRLCPACRHFEQTGYKPLINDYVDSGKVSLEFRDFLVHGPIDIAPTMLGECVSDQAFFPILEDMFDAQPDFLKKLDGMSRAEQQQMQSMKPTQMALMLGQKMGIIDFMKQHGMTEDKAKSCINDPAKFQKISDRMEKATQAGVSGTPSFFINGEQVKNAINWEDIRAALQRAGA